MNEAVVHGEHVNKQGNVWIGKGGASLRWQSLGGGRLPKGAKQLKLKTDRDG